MVLTIRRLRYCAPIRKRHLQLTRHHQLKSPALKEALRNSRDRAKGFSLGIALIALLCVEFSAGVATAAPWRYEPQTSAGQSTRHSSKTSARRTSFVATPLQDQQESFKVISRETYQRVLYILFPHDEQNAGYDFVLRFEPSFAPESQIVMKSGAERTTVTEYSSGSGNIYRKLNKLIANGAKEDADELAKLIEIKKTVVDVPATQAAAWRSNLAESISASVKLLEERAIEVTQGIGTVTIDGTFYTLWYVQDGNRVMTGVWDHEVSEDAISGDLRLVQWMNEVRRDVHALSSRLAARKR